MDLKKKAESTRLALGIMSWFDVISMKYYIRIYQDRKKSENFTLNSKLPLFTIAKMLKSLTKAHLLAQELDYTIRNQRLRLNNKDGNKTLHE